MENLHQKDFWEKKRARRDPSHPVIKAFAEPKIQYIRQVISESMPRQDRPMTLLDVGSGNGFLAYYFAPFYTTYCLDYSKFMLSINPCTKKVCASILNLPMASDTVDIVFCSNILHHLQDPLQAVKEMARVSKQYVVLSEPNRNNPLMLLFGLLKKEERGSLKFSRRFLKELVVGAGVEPLDAATLGLILPNKTPLPFLPVLKIFDGIYPLAFYSIVVGKNRTFHTISRQDTDQLFTRGVR